MKKRDLLKQLHNLKNTIKPDLQWQKANREILLSQIKSQTSLEFTFRHRIMAKNLFIAVYKPLGSFILIAGILLGAWIASVGATRNSLPGDFLYGWKLTTERMQVNLTLNDEKRTNVEMAFAERRLDEIKTTVANDDGSKQTKKNLAVPLKSFQESIINVKSNLVKLEATDKEAALKVADLIDEKTKTYVGILKDQQDQNPQLVTDKDAEQAILVSKATGDKALSVILEEFETGNSGLKIEDLKQKINARIEDLDKSIELAKGDIDKIIANKKIAEEAAAAKVLVDQKAAEEAAKKAEEETSAATKVLADEKSMTDKEAAAKVAGEAKPETTATEDATANTADNNTNTNVNTDINANTNTDIKTDANTNSQPQAENINSPENVNQSEPSDGQPEEVLPTIEEIKDKPQEAEALLAKAKDFLESGAVIQAFDLVKQADDIMTLVNKVIKANEQYLQAPVEVKIDETADVKREE